jgi:hypothetical protein
MPGDKSNKRKAAELNHQPEDAEAEIENDEFDEKGFAEEVAAETKHFEQLFGSLEKASEIANAYEYLMVLGNSHEDDVKRNAWAAYVNADGEEAATVKLWEVAIYRQIRQPFRFFLPGQKKLDPHTVHTLGTTIDYWIWFEREGKLSEKHREIAHRVEAEGGSRADMFLATMESFGDEMKIQKWDGENLNLLRLSICQVDSSQSGEYSSSLNSKVDSKSRS